MKSVLNNTEQMAFFVRRPIDLHKTLEMLPESRCERNGVCVCVCVCVCVSLAVCVTGTEQGDKGGSKANSGAVLLPPPSLLQPVPLLPCTHTNARTHMHTRVDAGHQPQRFLPSCGDHFPGSSGPGRASAAASTDANTACVGLGRRERG